MITVAYAYTCHKLIPINSKISLSSSHMTLCTFLHGCMFMIFEEKVACYLSSLFGLASICFSQKISKGGDCWILLASNKYSIKMLDKMFQHPGKVQCDLYLCLDLRTCFIFKESTCYFLLVKLRVVVYRIRTFVIS